MVEDSLKEKFIAIKKKGYIKGIEHGTGNIGRTFENELGIDRNNIKLPDYFNIEIKTKSIYRNKYITLFSMTPVGITNYEIKRICETYGTPDKEYKKYKCFYTSLYTTREVEINNYLFLINVNKKEKNLDLIVANKNNVIIDRYSYWDIKELEIKVNKKIQYIAIVEADKKKVNNIDYFKYQNMRLYKLKSFEKFIEGIEEEIIRVTFKIGINKKERSFGKIFDHGTSFDIESSRIEDIYDKYDYC